MRKYYASLLAFAAASFLSANAQQLPNANFEEGTHATSAWTSTESVSLGSSYLSPNEWTVAHVAGYNTGFLGWQGKTNVGALTSGYNSSNAIQVKNVSTLGNSIPGYITYGTPWNTANTTGNNKDGGTFGGISFTYRPDALSIMYKRTLASGSTEQATVVAYSWNGTFSQANVPGNVANSPTKVTMTDRDRNILGMSTTYGDTPTGNGKRVASLNHAITAAATEWTPLVIPFEYASNEAPQKINVIFSAANYFSTSPVKDNTLTVDDVKLLYYSRLASLAVSGAAVDGFNSDVYDYTIDALLPDASAITYTTLGNSQSGRVAVSLDTENAVATLTVTNINAGGTDIDGATSHIYTLHFNKPAVVDPDPVVYEGKKYTGALVVEMNDSPLYSGTNDNVYIKDNGNGTCCLTLPNFTLEINPGEPQNLGDIVVDPVTMTTQADGSVLYSANVPGYDKLMEGLLVCDLDINGTGKGNELNLVITVLWNDMPINVTFKAVDKFAGANVYNGSLVIEMNDAPLYSGNDDNVYITPTADGTCTVLLPDFTLEINPGEPQNLGDIVVENVTMTTVGGVTTYSATVPGYDKLMEGLLVCDLEINGTETNGVLEMVITVLWNDMPINVSFNGNRTLAAIGSVATDLLDPNAPAQFFNINGVRVAADNLTPGIYIMRQGSKTAKILIR